MGLRSREKKLRAFGVKKQTQYCSVRDPRHRSLLSQNLLTSWVTFSESAAIEAFVPTCPSPSLFSVLLLTGMREERGGIIRI